MAGTVMAYVVMAKNGPLRNRVAVEMHRHRGRSVALLSHRRRRGRSARSVAVGLRAGGTSRFGKNNRENVAWASVYSYGLCIVIACKSMAYVVMAYVVMAYVVMVSIVTVCIAMACIAMDCIVMAELFRPKIVEQHFGQTAL